MYVTLICPYQIIKILVRYYSNDFLNFLWAEVFDSKIILSFSFECGSILSTSTCICASASASWEGKFPKLFNHKLPSDITVTWSALGIDCSGENSIVWNESFQQFFKKRSFTDKYLTTNVLHSFNKSCYNNSLGVMHKLLWHSRFHEWLYWEYYCKLRKTKALWEL